MRKGSAASAIAVLIVLASSSLVEMMCIPSEMEQYYKDYGDPASGVPSSEKK
jgi:hypothetical protein